MLMEERHVPFIQIMSLISEVLCVGVMEGMAKLEMDQVIQPMPQVVLILLVQMWIRHWVLLILAITTPLAQMMLRKFHYQISVGLVVQCHM